MGLVAEPDMFSTPNVPMKLGKAEQLTMLSVLDPERRMARDYKTGRI